jgi:arylsulfatase A
MNKMKTFCLAVWLATLPVSAQLERPNFILILADDQGWNGTTVRMDQRITGSSSDYYETPAINRLAREGMRFSNGYAPAPLCTPTRRSIQFGMTPARQRGTMFKSTFEPTAHMSIPQMLKSIDPAYAAAHFGKWGHQMGASPGEVGYDESDGSTNNFTGGLTQDPEIRENNFFEKEDPKMIMTITRRAADFMERMKKAGRPFYLQVSHYAVHLDMQGTRASYEKYARKTPGKYHSVPGFAAMTADLDDGIGYLLDRVCELGLEDNTYILYMSDNGARNTVGGRRTGFDPPDKPAEIRIIYSYDLSLKYPCRNHPLLGSKHSLFEGGIRIPFIISGPGVRAGAQCDTPVTGWDILPTLADLAGLQGMLPGEIDGGSLKTLMLKDGKGRVRRPVKPLVFHYYQEQHINRTMSAIRIGKYKLVRLWGEDRNLLFDLEEDPGERHDLSRKMPGKTSKLYRKLMDYFHDVDARWHGKDEQESIVNAISNPDA